MRKHFAIVAAASLAVSGLALTGSEKPVFAQLDQQQDQQLDQQDWQHDDQQLGEQDWQRDDDLQLDQRDGIDRFDDRAMDHQELDEGQANNIRGTLATLTEAALTEGEFRSLVQRLSSDDQDRLDEYVNDTDFSDLDQQIQEFRDAWQERYGEQFAIDDRETVYDQQFAQFLQGHVDEARLVGERIPGELDREPEFDWERENDLELDTQPGLDEPGQPGEPRTPGQQPGLNGEDPAQPGAAQPGAQQPGAQQPGAQQQDLGVDQDFEAEGRIGADRDFEAEDRVGIDHDRDFADDRAMDEDRATVHISENREYELPEVTVHLINEGTIMDSWRIDVPDQVDGQTIHQNVEQALSKALERQDQWPEDVNEAQRHISHAILAAVVDADQDQMDMDRMHDPMDRDRELGEPGIGEPGVGEQPGIEQPGRQPGLGEQPGELGEQPDQQPGVGEQQDQQQPGVGY